MLTSFTSIKKNKCEVATKFLFRLRFQSTYHSQMTEEDKSLFLTREQKWLDLRRKLKAQFGKAPDLNAILFLIGIRELGKYKKKFSKEEKQDLMHIATCSVLSLSGYYELQGLDQDGWPHWVAKKKLPIMDLQWQEDFLKEHILLYFREMEY